MCESWNYPTFTSIALYMLRIDIARHSTDAIVVSQLLYGIRYAHKALFSPFPFSVSIRG